jgi:phospholipid/cholesterol/gamma-HCH transport system substrate-binding protein
MKNFTERSPYLMAAVGVGVTAVTVLAALNFDSLPPFNSGTDYSAYFAEASGLTSGTAVQVSGFQVGKVSSVELDGAKVLVTFRVDHVRLGDRTEASVRLTGLLGNRVVELTPRGDRELTGPIPTDRTTPAYELPDALGDLSTTVKGLNTDQLSNSLAVLSDTFSDTPPQLREAVRGVARVSDSLDKRDAQLRDLLRDANAATKVLAERSDEVVGLVTNANALLVELKSQSGALDGIFNNLSDLAQQIKGFIAENRDTLKPALDKLNGVLTIVDNRKERVQTAIKKLNSYALGLGEAVSSGPFFKAYLVNLLPGQFVQPFIDAAFSDLGLDPNVLLPTQRADPQTGQPGTPPLPVPYPRTGQGGEPRRNLPDAITGKPGDPRYPYREPPPAPAPGGPPPGPPAVVPPSPTPPAQGGGQ